MSDFRQLNSGLFVPSGTAYEGASAHHRFADDVYEFGANDAVDSSLRTLTSRAQHFERNNPWAQSAVNSWCAAAVGQGIKPRWKIDDIDEATELQEYWKFFAQEADFNEKQSFYGLQATALRTTIGMGTAYAIRRDRPLSDDLAVPLQIQIVEPTQLCKDIDDGQRANGDYVRSGILYSREGKKKAFCFYKFPPLDNKDTDNPKVWVKASNVAAMHRVDRPGQEGGVPWISSVLLRLRELDQYEDAELVRKKMAAIFMMAIEEDAPAPSDSGYGQGPKKSKGRIPRTLRPGAVPILPAGKKATFSSPADVGTTYEPWLRFQLLSIAKGYGITYEMLTGDLKNVNYSSIRAGLIEFRRLCEQVQQQIIIFQFCRPVVTWFLDTLFMYQIVGLPNYNMPRVRRSYINNIHWQLPRWDEVDPLKKVMADLIETRAGFSTLPDKQAERGHDMDSFIQTMVMVNKTLDKYNIILDSDARKVDGKGAYQSMAEAVNMTEASSDE